MIEPYGAPLSLAIPQRLRRYVMCMYIRIVRTNKYINGVQKQSPY